MARTAPNARPSPDLTPVAAPSTHSLAEDGYRLAVCLLDDEGAAAALLLRIVGALRPRRWRRPTPAVRAVVLRWLIAGARAARLRGAVPPSARGAVFPELQALPVAEREVLALVVACDLDVGDAARVLRTDPTRVLALRRTAVRRVAAFARADAGGDAATAWLHRPA
jgi:hypothetical protein